MAATIRYVSTVVIICLLYNTVTITASNAGDSLSNQILTPDDDLRVDFDCKIRQLMLRYGQSLQPFRGKSSWLKMVNELNRLGGDPGGKTLCSNLTYTGSNKEFLPQFPLPTSGLTIYVSTDGKDNNGEGTLQSPYATIEYALNKIRTIRINNKSVADASMILRGGVYYLRNTVILNELDSFLTIQNYLNETVTISGSRILKNLKWTPLSSNVNIYSVNVSEFINKNEDITGLRVNGDRAVRARYPNGCTSTSPTSTGYVCQGWSKNNTVVNPIDGFGSSLSFYWILPPVPTMHQANWTEFNPSFPKRESGLSFQTYQIGIGGTCHHFTPPAGYWCGNMCDGGNGIGPACIARWPLGVLLSPTVVPRSVSYSAEDYQDMVVHAWHPAAWFSMMYTIDATKSNATHLYFARGGFQGAHGLNVAGYESNPTTAFIENVFQELDASNEFFYNKTSQVLYYYSESKLSNEVFEIPSLKILFQISGTQSNPVKNITLRGITFTNTELTYLDDHTMPSGGDWGLGLNAAVMFTGVENSVVDSCHFIKLDGNVMLLKGYTRKIEIINNEFEEIGDNIIGLLGDTEGVDGVPGFGWDGTRGSQPRQTLIKNNFALNCGLFEKQSSFLFHAKAMESVIQNNIFFHGPRAGINLNDGFGGGNLFEANILFNTVMESGDHGPFNSWDRQPYAHELNADGTPNIQKSYDELRYNLFMGNYYGQEAVDNDDGSAYFKSHHNVFVYGGSGMKNDFNGHDNHHYSNVYAFISLGVGICGSLPNHQDAFYDNHVIQTVTSGYASYDCDCYKNQSCPIFHTNSIYTNNGTMDKVCNQSVEERNASGIDKGTVVLSWPSADYIIALAKSTLNFL